jgi:hypothetical protein
MANPTPTALVTLGGVMVCWFYFAGIFLLRKRPPKEKEARRDGRAAFGIILQVRIFSGLVPAASHRIPAASGGIVWSRGNRFRRVHDFPRGPVDLVHGIRGANAGQAVGGGGTPGRGPQANHGGSLRLCAESNLYRHAWNAGRDRVGDGTLAALVAGFVLFTIGLMIRVRTEEKLLRSAFGQEFEEYSKRVPMLLPALY